jgi:FMN hydrolase / 5-amino-6-(5-phospho-D-ribitylamino)uracil phosphatase
MRAIVKAHIRYIFAKPYSLMPYSSIQAITLDLDDTLWPVWPTIKKAEAALHDWLKTHAPSTAALLETPETMRGRRETLIAEFPHLAHDYNFLRTEAIRRSLVNGGDDPALAAVAYEVFTEARNNVELFDDALPALQYLAAKYPIVAISNGTADIQRVGLVKYFKGAISAHEFGIAKPDPRIFKAAAAAVGVSVANVLHVGDDCALDAVGALQSGMHAAWLNRDGKDWPHDADFKLESHHQSLRHVNSLSELCELL